MTFYTRRVKMSIVMDIQNNKNLFLPCKKSGSDGVEEKYLHQIDFQATAL